MDVAAPEETDCEHCEVVELSDAQSAARRISRLHLADLKLPTGAIVACDPLQQWTRPAFARRVAPGRYPVTLYFRDRPGLAAVRFATRPVVRWELALLPGQAIESLAPGETFGFALGSGFAALLDASTAPLIDRRIARLAADLGEHGVDYYEDALEAELRIAAAGNFRWCNHRPLPDESGNAIVFSTGARGGCHESWWGLGHGDQPVVLVLDFGGIESRGARVSRARAACAGR